MITFSQRFQMLGYRNINILLHFLFQTTSRVHQQGRFPALVGVFFLLFLPHRDRIFLSQILLLNRYKIIKYRTGSLIFAYYRHLHPYVRIRSCILEIPTCGDDVHHTCVMYMAITVSHLVGRAEQELCSPPGRLASNPVICRYFLLRSSCNISLSKWLDRSIPRQFPTQHMQWKDDGLQLLGQLPTYRGCDRQGPEAADKQDQQHHITASRIHPFF